jgi:hypothetical protein
MTHIYYIINKNQNLKDKETHISCFTLKDNETQRIWYIDFLKIMSDCFLPDFNYLLFMGKFEKIVSQFLASFDDLYN